MRKKIALFVVLSLILTIIPGGPLIAADSGIGTLNQAVQAAWSVNSQSAADVAQANTTALNVADTVIDLDFAQAKVASLETEEAMLKQQADQADMEFKMGKIDARTLDSWRQEVTQNKFDLNFQQMKVDNGKKEFQKLTGQAIAPDFDYQAAYLITDAGKLSLPPSADQTQEKQLNDAIVAFSNLGNLIADYIKAGDKLNQTENDFKTGKAGQADLESAQADKEKARINALEGKADYSKLLYGLDCSLQGDISRTLKKLPNPIFRSSSN
ncbi:hypothetical protein REC12_24440 [Desulfosporosinus sp. PR]|uniref:hypothetical protein n=1 Tax=Candidatus Desulfosporosinus nitrosoreducens TaxID=3401928 RepID=UPI0027EA0D1A|nr:hypothetical protein [Desulfosporosinus sp. PR]MDQ7096746.1 hypothetical protein [Desulfosporosinus sp. PR]